MDLQSLNNGAEQGSNNCSQQIGTDPVPGIEPSISRIKRQKGLLKCLNASRDQIRLPFSYSSLRIALPRSEGDQDHVSFQHGHQNSVLRKMCSKNHIM